MNIFQEFFQSTQLYAKALLLNLEIIRLQLRMRLCIWKLLVSRRNVNTTHNLKDELWGYQIESQSLRVRVHWVMAARKLKERVTWDKMDKWRG